jgi:hypothetical protein
MASSKENPKTTAEKIFRSQLVMTLHNLRCGDARHQQMAAEDLARLGLTEREARRRLSAKLPK